ncbi:unnamed protein product [Oppiella nova]|uniref:Uncharacterized protein n=1 Tax=Oppiella nova TaxID=334625 RepID=A0A7R9M2R5_9ACAR|nr:unnamed protein product [Oppiella nova]CAG2169686.1 unnamed protein product [Oppiella nova]
MITTATKDKQFYSIGQPNNWDTKKINDGKVVDLITDKNSAKKTGISLYFQNMTKKDFGDYRCKVDYWSEIDGKTLHQDSYRKVTVGRIENSTFYINNHDL